MSDKKPEIINKRRLEYSLKIKNKDSYALINPLNAIIILDIICPISRINSHLAFNKKKYYIYLL